MDSAAEALDFEAAALIRDRIRALSLVQGHQDIHVAGIVDADVIAAHQAGGQTCVQVFFFRGGQNWGNRAYFPSHDRQLAVEEVLTAFVGQFYDNRPKPPLVLLSHPLVEQDLVEEALSLRGGRVTLAVPQRGDKKKLVDRIAATAREALGRRLAESASQRQLLDGVAAAFGLSGPLNRIEVYDNSHIQGTQRGRRDDRRRPRRADEKRLPQVHDPRHRCRLAPADGRCAAATQGPTARMSRRTRNWRRRLRDDARGVQPPLRARAEGRSGARPRHMARSRADRRRTGPADSSARQVFAELGIDDLAIVAIAKGPDRNAGRERFFLPGRPPFSLEPRDPVLYFLQRLRDEAHRFAIGAHRAKRTKAIGRSPLDEIPGIGARRKQALLHHFGSARAVARAGLAEIERVAGISKTVAKKVYDHFHADG